MTAQTMTVRKWFWVWEFEKETQWLDQMARSGWVLEAVGFCKYTFAPCEPGAYTVRLEMRGDDPNYISFMQETGAEYVGRMGNWIYFRKRAEHGMFDLFSDLDSRMAHLQKIGRMLLTVGGACLLITTALWLIIVLMQLHPALFALCWVDLIGSVLLFYALGRIHGTMEMLEKERLLRE